MLTVRDLHIAFEKQKVLENLNISFQPGKIHGIVGLNGSGKTTLLNTIYGFIKPDQGQLFWSENILTPSIIAYLETSNYFYSRITGMEYLELYRLSNPSFDIAAWNSMFELPLNNLIDTYSTGMKKKLALLGVLCLNRPVLMLDEPFNGLDLESNRKIHFILQRLSQQNRTIIITSHIMETLTGNCDSISLLNNKHIEFSLEKSKFHELEDHIFSSHDEKSKQLINQLLGKSFN